MLEIAITFAWGVLVLLSFIGWGRTAGRWVDREAKFDVGLCAAWGVAIVLFFGGVLNATRLCGYTAVITIVLLGLGLFSLQLWQDPPRSNFAGRLGFVPLAIALFSVYLTSVAFFPTANWNPYDDYAAYLTYPIKMLQTGAADDPFSLRRIATLGGPAFLQATACFFMWPRSAFLIDMGLGNVIACLLIVGFLRRRGETAFLSTIPCFAILLLPIGRINSMPIMLCIAEFLALFCTLSLAAESRSPARRRLFFAAGAVATALVTLRPNFLPTVGLALLFCALFAGAGGIQTWRKNLIELRCAFVAATITFLPWSIALYRSSATFLWPLMRGNEQRRFNLTTANLPPWPLLGFIVFFFLQPLVLVAVSLGIFAFRRFNLAAISLWLAALIGTIITVARFSLSDYPNLTRYSLPQLAAAGMAALLCTQFGSARDGFRIFGRVVMALLAVILLFPSVQNPGMLSSGLASLKRGIYLNLPLISPGFASIYAAAQSRIPPGRTILCMTDFPFLFDFHRNTIACADMPGLASPGAAMPYGQGPEALRNYLKKQQIDYLLCADFNTEDFPAYCCRRFWDFRLNCPPDTDSRVPIDRPIAAAMLDFMDNVDAIARRSADTFSRDGLRIIPLRADK